MTLWVSWQGLGTHLSGTRRRARRPHLPAPSPLCVLWDREMNVALSSLLRHHPPALRTPWLADKHASWCLTSLSVWLMWFPELISFMPSIGSLGSFCKRGNKLMDHPHSVLGSSADPFETVDISLSLCKLSFPHPWLTAPSAENSVE